MNESMKVKGDLVIELIREGQVVDKREVTNVITTNGVNLIATLVSGSGTAFSDMAIGTDSTSESASDQTLGAEVGRVTLTSKNVSSATISYVGDFPAGTGTGSITEAGIFNASSNGTMLNRTTFSAVNKTASDALKITWNVSFS